MAEKKGGSPHASEQQANQDQRVVPPVAAIINANAPRPCSQAEPCYTHNATPEHLLPQWRRPEWVIVYVTVIYSFLTGLMWWKIKQQANLMERQIGIQAAGLRQWVELGKSTCSGDDLNNASGMALITLHYDLINTTPYPLTVRTIIWKVKRADTHKDEWQSFEAGWHDFILPPLSSNQNSPYPCLITLAELSSKSIADFNADRYMVDVVGCITFEEITGTIREQRFPHLALCGPGSLMRIGMMGSDKGTSQTYDSHDPN